MASPFLRWTATVAGDLQFFTYLLLYNRSVCLYTPFSVVNRFHVERCSLRSIGMNVDTLFSFFRDVPVVHVCLLPPRAVL